MYRQKQHALCHPAEREVELLGAGVMLRAQLVLHTELPLIDECRELSEASVARGRSCRIEKGTEMSGHDEHLAFDPTPVPRDGVDQSKFECWKSGIDLYARGPCPRCHAPEQVGHMTRQAPLLGSVVEKLGGSIGGKILRGLGRSERARRTPPPRRRTDLPMSCSCPSKHARPEGSGCGARWVVAWKEGE